MVEDKGHLILLPGISPFPAYNAAVPDDPEEQSSAIEAPSAELLIPVIEAVLFAADRPLSVADLEQIVGATATQIRAAIQVIQDSGVARGAGIRVDEVAGGFQFRTQPKTTEWVSRLQDVKPVRLSNAAVETLAIIAYRQPVTRQGVEELRGVDCGGMVRNLVHRGLVKTMGRADAIGRPLMYGTTSEFLEFFGMRDLSDLPALRDLREMQADDPNEGPQTSLF